MAMVVTCRSCRARFRLDEALLKDAKGARIRCRKCGGYIIVRNPEAPPVPPASAVDPEVASVRVEAPRGRTSPAPSERKTVEADLSGRIRPVPTLSPPGEEVVPPAGKADPVPSARARRKVPLLEEALIPPAAAGAVPNPFGDGTLKEMGSPRPGVKASSRRPPHARPLVLIVSLSILLLAGGALYLGAMKPGQNLPGKWFPAWGSTNRVSAPESPVFEIQEVKLYRNKQTTGENLYVIKGIVANVGKGNSTGILVQAVLLGVDNQAIVKNEAFAGNLIDESLLPHMSRVRIEGFLGMRYGEGNANREIPAGKSLPFMVVFFDPPGGVESFSVRATDADEAGRIHPPDGKEASTRAFNQRTIRLN